MDLPFCKFSNGFELMQLPNTGETVKDFKNPGKEKKQNKQTKTKH